MQFYAAAADEPETAAPALPAAATAPRSSADDRARLRAMFDDHHQLVWRTMRRYGLDPEAAADVAQHAFLIAIERVGDIWPGSERAFLIGTALRLARGARRSAARVQPEGRLEERVRQPGRAESQAMTVELLDRVLSKLDPSLIEVFVLFDVEGFSAPEIARTLEIPTGTVASRIRRARAEFRAAAERLERLFEREEGVR